MKYSLPATLAGNLSISIFPISNIEQCYGFGSFCGSRGRQGARPLA